MLLNKKQQKMILTRLQKLAGIKLVEGIEGSTDSIGGSDLHILNNTNSSMEKKDMGNGASLTYFKINLQQDLSEADIDTLMTELKLVKDKLANINHPNG